MKFKKTIIFSIVILIVFCTWINFHGNNINYVVLGDSVPAGVNPYGEIGYSYADYFKDYLVSNKKDVNYIKGFAVSGYKTSNIINDINLNKELNVNGKDINIRRALRESDIVSISIGANDFIKNIDLNSFNLDNISIYQDKIDSIMVDVDEVLSLIRKYAKKEIYLVGYYNPFPILFSTYNDKLDTLFFYQDDKYIELCKKYNIKYISTYKLFKENPNFLPNPFDIHPNLDGHKAISKLIINEYIKK